MSYPLSLQTFSKNPNDLWSDFMEQNYTQGTTHSTGNLQCIIVTEVLSHYSVSPHTSV